MTCIQYPQYILASIKWKMMKILAMNVANAIINLAVVANAVGDDGNNDNGEGTDNRFFC